MRPRRRPSSGASASVMSAGEPMCARGMSSRWVGARGAMSRIAITRSSAWTTVAGISPATMRQKRQSALIRGLRRRVLARSRASPQGTSGRASRSRARDRTDRSPRSGPPRSSWSDPSSGVPARTSTLSSAWPTQPPPSTGSSRARSAPPRGRGLRTGHGWPPPLRGAAQPGRDARPRRPGPPSGWRACPAAT